MTCYCIHTLPPPITPCLLMIFPLSPLLLLLLLAGMLAYGMVKSSTHFLVQSVSQDPAFVEKEASALCVLPSVIDTPGNRAAMPAENFENWTKSDDIAQLLVEWVKGNSRGWRERRGIVLYTIYGMFCVLCFMLLCHVQVCAYMMIGHAVLCCVCPAMLHVCNCVQSLLCHV